MLPLSVDNEEIPESSAKSSVLSMQDFGLLYPEKMNKINQIYHYLINQLFCQVLSSLMPF